MKILLMIFLLPMTVYASSSLCGSASATIENRKGFYIFPPEDAPDAGEAVDGPVVDVDFDSGEEATAEEFDEPTVDDELMFTAEEQDLADTELFEE